MALKTDLAAQRRVDEEIAAEIERHKECVKALKIRRNSFCAVNQLPNDVLTHILLFVKLQAEASSDAGAFSSEAYSEWIGLLRVCHLWYDSMQGHPRFWTTISLDSPHVLRMWDLSKAAPLEIMFSVPWDAGDSLLSLVSRVISESHRLQDLEMNAQDYNALSKVLSLIPASSSVANLERLNIVVDADWGEASGTLWSKMPSLRSLRLFGAPLSSIPNPKSMQHLKELLINVRGLHPDQRVSIPWLLKTLRFLPNLHSLDIPNLFGPSVDPDCQPVSLPCLQSLNLVSDDASTLTIFNNLIIPPSANIEIVYMDNHTDAIGSADMSGLKSTVARIVSTVTSVEEIAITLSGLYFEITVTFNLPHEGSSHPPSSMKPYLRCTFPPIHSDNTDILLQVCALFPFGETSTLSLAGVAACEGLSFIPSSPKIHTLVLRDCDIQVLRSLVKPKDAPRPPNPNLRSIHFYKTPFRNKRRQRNGMFSLLCDILRERAAYLMPIKVVKFEECNVGYVQVEDLQELAEVVRE
ncbi:hypothetical protein ONZ45_g11712 [Pleurotus djamor]|nr:hypothetical protein ONZ45_g11712 [Pleurotus djamor]